MAAVTSFTSLSAPAPDDTMEMSSPANRPLDDDDIDIDFDDYPAPENALDDEHMLEDDPTRPATAPDELMEEDVDLTEHVQEEVMQDDGLHMHEAPILEDDELIDYSEDEELQDTAVDDAEVANDTVAPEPLPEVAEEDQFDEEIEPYLDESEAQAQVLDLSNEVPTETAQISDPLLTEPLPVAADLASETIVDANAEALLEAQQNGSYEELRETEFDAADQEDAEDSAEHAITINTALEASAEGPDTPTDTGLHPMTLQYKDIHIPLFKSRKQLDGLLKDDNLANVSLADLMSSCRQRLPLKTNEDITDDQDLVLSFDQLALMLVEDSRAASSTSLNEVLQVYLQLHHNDGIEEVPPVSLTLSTQPRFSSSISMFRQAVAGGQGMSSFSFLHASNDVEADHDQYAYDGGEEWTGLTGHEDPNHVTEQQYAENTYAEQGGVEAGSYEQHEPQDANDEQYQDARQDYYFDETAQGDYDETYQGEAADALDGLTGQTAKELYDAEGEAQTAEANHDLQVPVQGDLEAAAQDHAVSATSETVEGDKETADTTAGEYYDEELIDWDDDSLTTFDSDNTDHTQNKDTTVSTAYDPVEAKADQDEQLQLGSEDWLNEFAEPDGAHQDGEENQQGYGQEAAQDDQTNNPLPTQHDHDGGAEDAGNQPDYQFGEGQDEQAMAHHEGGTQGDFYEHGLEHIDFHEDVADDQGDDDEFDDTVLIHRPNGEGYDESYQEPGPEGQYQEEYDDLGFDEDEATEEQQIEAVEPLADATTSKDFSGGSPSGKRSFDEIDDLEDDTIELPEVKKVRSS
ncbi:hypothetical protein LTR09_001835 [Extremus antarcticus]|uniref:Uncharacterized protein n=1 Tax=Extremus antarcticus TaxID=702011 RepID=A0AAJ0GHH7_9PEZI|nr:hypothetical protein LTR09_001835 [Extremus antarcticus]